MSSCKHLAKSLRQFLVDDSVSKGEFSSFVFVCTWEAFRAKLIKRCVKLVFNVIAERNLGTKQVVPL